MILAHSGFGASDSMGFDRKTFCLIIILSITVAAGVLGGSGPLYRAENPNSGDGNSAGSGSNDTNNNNNKPPIVPACGCNSSEVSFRAMSWNGTRARIVVTNNCEYGMGDVLVSCVGWKQQYVEDKSVLGVAADSKSCVLFPGSVLRGGEQYDFYVDGAPLAILFNLEPVTLPVKYFCYDCNRCSSCCRR